MRYERSRGKYDRLIESKSDQLTTLIAYEDY